MRYSKRLFLGLMLGCTTFNGCSWTANQICQKEDFCFKPSMVPSQGVQQLRPSEPCIDDVCIDHWVEPTSPMDLNEAMLSSENTMEMSLQNCIYTALSNSKIIRDLGGTILRAPESMMANVTPAMTYTDPRLGEEAALSEFDAQLVAGLNFDKNDRVFNNTFFGNNGALRQDLHNYQWGLRKKSATGAEFNFRHVTGYDSNNQVSNTFKPSSWDTYLEAEVRQPLLQGAGTEFNRIAGPNGTPGNINGVVIGRVRTDISLAEFERSVRDLVADVENAYWDLYFAYRDLEAKIEARDAACTIYDRTKGRGEDKGDTEQAKEQFLRFQADVIDSLNGRPTDSTRTNNGSSGGTFRGSGGLRFSERRLRLIMGLPINDGKLVRPLDPPSVAPVVYDWSSAIADGLTLRPELRKQRWVVEHRKLELIANRNFLRPDLDIVGRYRFRGFGQDLVDLGGGSNAVGNLADGDLQEWSAGVEYTVPIGFRKAHTAVRNSQLALAREVEILKEQERAVTFGLSNALNELRRAYQNTEIQRERLVATSEQIYTLDDKMLNSSASAIALDVYLEAHRRLLDTRLRYHQAEIDYAIANRNVHFEKGTLLKYCEINLLESQPSAAERQDAAERESLRGEPHEPAHREPIIGQTTSASG
jgi:outer membrane protein TolC